MKKLVIIFALCHSISACETLDEWLITPSPKYFVNANFSEANIDELISLIGPPTEVSDNLDFYTYVWGNEEVAEICTSEIMQPTNQGMQPKARRTCSRDTYYCKLFARVSKADRMISDIRWREKPDRLRSLGKCPDWLIDPIRKQIRYEQALKRAKEKKLQAN